MKVKIGHMMVMVENSDQGSALSWHDHHLDESEKVKEILIGSL